MLRLQSIGPKAVAPRAAVDVAPPPAPAPAAAEEEHEPQSASVSASGSLKSDRPSDQVQSSAIKCNQGEPEV